MLSFPMTDAQFANASNRLRAAGVEFNGPSGTLSKDGITARYAHGDGVLTVEIVDKPFLLPLSLIESKLQAYIQESIASPQ